MPENSLGFGLRSRARRPSAVPTREALEAVLYDKAYSWELQPGSDVMATCIGVLPKVGVSGSYTCYGGLVTVPATTVPEVAFNGGHWMLIDPETALTADAAMNIDGGYFGLDDAPAGLYLAVWYGNPDPGPPYAFPAGWTPGNTTGSGPVLPLVHPLTYAGLVDVEAGLIPVPTGDANWGLYEYDTSSIGWDDVSLSAVVANVNSRAYEAGTYLAVLFSADEAPTELPTGWTVRPFGIGPIAITDENAGGLIGDVAYVVSGWIQNRSAARRIVEDLEVWEAGSTHAVQVGDRFAFGSSNYEVGTAGHLTAGDPAVSSLTSSDGAYAAGLNDPGYWPFIERYDLVAKKWLPRIPLPTIDKVISEVPAIVVNHLGTYVPGYFNKYDSVVQDGTTYYLMVDGPYADGAGPALSGTAVWSTTDPTRAAIPEHTIQVPAASEGGIAGVIDSKLYFGGGDGDDVTGTEFFVYDPVDDSIMRLHDLPGDYPDYTPYGVAAGKMWHFGFDGQPWVYDPADDAGGWVQVEWSGTDLSNEVGDQTQGFEIDGKLWFVADGKAFVFDPVALTVTAKATFARTGGGGGQPFLIDGKIHEFVGGVRLDPAVYDPTNDTWALRTDVVTRSGSDYDAEFVGVTYDGVPYLLSGVTGTGEITPPMPGVYGMTGVAIDRPFNYDQRETAKAAAQADVRARDPYSLWFTQGIHFAGGVMLDVKADGSIGSGSTVVFLKAGQTIGLATGNPDYAPAPLAVGSINVSAFDLETSGGQYSANFSYLANGTHGSTILGPASADCHVLIMAAGLDGARRAPNT